MDLSRRTWNIIVFVTTLGTAISWFLGALDWLLGPELKWVVVGAVGWQSVSSAIQTWGSVAWEQLTWLGSVVIHLARLRLRPTRHAGLGVC